MKRCFLNERLKNIFLKNRDMRFIKMTGGLGNQMFIYAFYMRMKKHYSNTRIDLSDMVHYKAHNGYELHRIFNLPPIEFRINQPLKKVIEFLFFKKIYERKQVTSSLVPYDKKYFWPLLYFKGFYQSERFFADMADDIRKAFTFNPRLSNKKTKEMSEQIDHDENAVSIHVRRGDYLEPKYWKTTGCVCQLPYYLNAIAEMNKRISLQCVRYFETYPERIQFNDQDLLNVVLCKDKVFVPLKWNMQDGFYRYGIDKRVVDWQAFREELLHPVILHYTNKKPWNYDSMHPLRNEYYKYLDMTPWKGKRPLSSVKERLKRYIKCVPYLLGLRKPKYVNLGK